MSHSDMDPGVGKAFEDVWPELKQAANESIGKPVAKVFVQGLGYVSKKDSKDSAIEAAKKTISTSNVPEDSSIVKTHLKAKVGILGTQIKLSLKQRVQSILDTLKHKTDTQKKTDYKTRAEWHFPAEAEHHKNPPVVSNRAGSQQPLPPPVDKPPAPVVSKEKPPPVKPAPVLSRVDASAVQQEADNRTLAMMQKARAGATARAQTQEAFKLQTIQRRGNLNPVSKVEQNYYIPISVLESASPNATGKDLVAALREQDQGILLNKDDAISSMRTYISLIAEQGNLTDQQEQALQGTLNALKQLNAEQGFISKNEIRSKLKEIETAFPGISARILANCTEYCSTYDIYMRQGQQGPQDIESFVDTLRDKKLWSMQHVDRAAFAIKTGAESFREILSSKILKMLPFHSLYVTKKQVDLPNTELGGQIAPPDAIAGKWLQDAKTIARNSEQDMMYDRQGVNFARWKNQEPPAEIARREEEYKKNDLKFMCKIGVIPESAVNQREEQMDPAVQQRIKNYRSAVQGHALVDCLLQSRDSHGRQYAITDGVPKGFDLSRFLPIHSVIGPPGKVFFSFKSEFLDHYAASLPLDEHWISEIEQINIEAIENNLKAQNLLLEENDGAFEKAQKELEQTVNHRQQVSSLLTQIAQGDIKACDELRTLLSQYGVTVNPPEQNQPINCEQLDLAISQYRKSWDDRSRELVVPFYSCIHPNSFTQFKQRLQATKDYIRHCQETNTSPTVSGAFDAMYPDIALFMKVLRRSDPHPSLEMGNISLEDVANNSNNYATPDEIQAMQEALERLQAQKGTNHSLLFTMDYAPLPSLIVPMY